VLGAVEKQPADECPRNSLGADSSACCGALPKGKEECAQLAALQIMLKVGASIAPNIAKVPELEKAARKHRLFLAARAGSAVLVRRAIGRADLPALLG
jgi:hypothetical protein